LEINHIYNEDCIEGIKKIDFPVHLVVTSPPYNVGLGDNMIDRPAYDKHDDSMELEDYLHFIDKTFRVIYDKLDDDGRVAINIADTRCGKIPMHIYYANLMTAIGYKTYGHLVWDKDQITNKFARGSYKSPNCPAFLLSFEYILCFYKNERKRLVKGETDLTKEEFLDWTLGIWRFPPERHQRKIGHPAMFPEELPKRAIKMFTWLGDTVLDPFSGAGTTALAAKRLGRNYVGFDISKTYCDIAESRIKALDEQQEVV